MTRSIHLPVLGQRIAVPVQLTTHTLPPHRPALRKRLKQWRSDVYRLVDMADQRFPSYPTLAARSIEAVEEITALIEGALWKETITEHEAAQTQGASA